MQIISDLKEREAVEFDGGYLVHLGSGDYEFGESKMSINGYGGRQFAVNDIDTVYRITKSEQKLIGFVKKAPDGDRTDEPFGSLEEYYRLVKANSNGIECGFDSLDDEFNIRTSLKKYNDCFKVFSEPEIIRTKVDINVIGSLQDTGSDFIHSALHVGKTEFYGGRGVFKVRLAAIALDEFNKLKAEHPKLTNATHSNIEYAQYGGSYIFTSEKHRPGIDGKTGSEAIYKTLEQAKAAEADLRTFVRRQVNLYAKPVTLGSVEATTLTELVNTLQSVNSSLNATKSMQKTKGQLSHAKTKLNEAINLVKGCVEV